MVVVEAALRTATAGADVPAVRVVAAVGEAAGVAVVAYRSSSSSSVSSSSSEAEELPMNQPCPPPRQCRWWALVLVEEVCPPPPSCPIADGLLLMGNCCCWWWWVAVVVVVVEGETGVQLSVQVVGEFVELPLLWLLFWLLLSHAGDGVIGLGDKTQQFHRIVMVHSSKGEVLDHTVHVWGLSLML